MNNPKSTALGWASLVAAAGVSYYFAKKGINERREKQAADGSRPTEKLDWRQKIEGSTNTAANGPSRSAQSAFENAKEQTGNTGPNVKARPASNDETPMVVENLRVTK